MAVGGCLGAPMSSYAAPGDKTSGRGPRGVLEKGRRRACNHGRLLLMLLLDCQRQGRRRDGKSGR